MVFVRVSVSVIRHYARNNLGRKGFIYLACTSVHSPSGREVRARTQGNNLEARTEADSLEEMLLIGSFLVTFLACFLAVVRATQIQS